MKRPASGYSPSDLLWKKATTVPRQSAPPHGAAISVKPSTELHRAMFITSSVIHHISIPNHQLVGGGSVEIL